MASRDDAFSTTSDDGRLNRGVRALNVCASGLSGGDDRGCLGVSPKSDRAFLAIDGDGGISSLVGMAIPRINAWEVDGSKSPLLLSTPTTCNTGEACTEPDGTD